MKIFVISKPIESITNLRADLRHGEKCYTPSSL